MPRWAVPLASLALCYPVFSAPITFHHDIAPILYRSCAGCHRPGEAAPFPLLEYGDARKHAGQIAAVTRSRFMPPWLPQPGYGEFAGEQRLTEEQIRLIGEWAQQGAPEGSPSGGPPAPHFTGGWQLGTPDLVVEAPSAFQVPASGRDLYWNFVFRPEIAARRFVRALEIRPGNPRLVHHANLLIDRTGSTPLSGVPGMDLTVMRSPFDPDSHFLFWKPGSPVRTEPDGFAWRLDPGNELVLNTHLRPSGKAESVRPVIGLYFTDRPPTKFPLVFQLEADRSLKIPAGVSDFLVRDDFRLPMDVDVLAVYPHAHYLGKLLEAYATLPDGSRKWLIRIPDWNPDWQAVYDYREPVRLPQGAVISMRYHYDNSARNVRNPNVPPRRVVGGDQATDEMAHLWLQILPHGPGDRRREFQEALFRHRLEKDPGDFEANFNLGAVMLSRLDPQGAVTALRAAVQAQPGRADARNMLGLALAATGRSPEAIAQYDAALQIRPEYSAARFNRANALLKAGRLDEAIADYRKVVEALPDDALPKQRLQEALAQRK